MFLFLRVSTLVIFSNLVFTYSIANPLWDLADQEFLAGTYVVAVRSFGGYGDIGTYALNASIEATQIPIPGDSNHDGVFDSSDLVQVFQFGEYEDAIAGNSTFEEGDWNGDGDFDSSDMVFAFQAGTFVRAARRMDAAVIDPLFAEYEKPVARDRSDRPEHGSQQRSSADRLSGFARDEKSPFLI